MTVGKTPHAILLSDDDKRAYVHNVGDNSISVIDVEAAAVVRTLRLPKLDRPDSRPGYRPALVTINRSMPSTRPP